MKYTIITIIAVIFSLTASAQDIFTDLRRDVPGQGKVTVNQSEEIENLVRKAPEQPIETTDNTETIDNAAKERRNAAVIANEAAQRRQATADANEKEESSVANTTRKIMRHSYKATGYRIQVYSGGNKRTDRTKCEQIAVLLKKNFPNLPVYVHFYSPSWKCRAGNFTSAEEANKMLQQIKRLGYPQACLVKGTINVQY